MLPLGIPSNSCAQDIIVEKLKTLLIDFEFFSKKGTFFFKQFLRISESIKISFSIFKLLASSIQSVPSMFNQYFSVQLSLSNKS